MKGLDTVGWFIASLHQFLGHRAAAHYLGMPVEEGEQADCILCQYENGTATREAVIERIGSRESER